MLPRQQHSVMHCRTAVLCSEVGLLAPASLLPQLQSAQELSWLWLQDCERSCVQTGERSSPFSGSALGWFLHDGLIRSLWHLAHAAEPEGVSSLNPTVAINPHPAHSHHLSWGGPRAIPLSSPPNAGPPYVGTHSSSRKRRRRKALGCSWLMLFMLRSLWGRRHSQISHSAACTE